MKDSCWFPQVLRGEYGLIPCLTLFGLEQVWNGHGMDTQRNVNFEILLSLVWNEFGDLFRISGIGVWIGMCVSPCSGPIILSGSHMGAVLIPFPDNSSTAAPFEDLSRNKTLIWDYGILVQKQPKKMSLHVFGAKVNTPGTLCCEVVLYKRATVLEQFRSSFARNVDPLLSTGSQAAAPLCMASNHWKRLSGNPCSGLSDVCLALSSYRIGKLLGRESS